MPCLRFAETGFVQQAESLVYSSKRSLNKRFDHQTERMSLENNIIQSQEPIQPTPQAFLNRTNLVASFLNLMAICWLYREDPVPTSGVEKLRGQKRSGGEFLYLNWVDGLVIC